MPSGISYRWISAEPVRLAADPLRLAQVFSNLLTNAAKYTDPEGHIHLALPAHAEHRHDLRHGQWHRHSAGRARRIFAMFSQVKSSAGSFGGRPGHRPRPGERSRRAARRHDRGAQRRHGARQRVHRPPARRAVPVKRRQLSKPDATAATCSRRVLIADDNRDAAESLAMLLPMEGHDVTVAHDGKEALAAFEQARPDVALLDIGMPEDEWLRSRADDAQSGTAAPITLIAVTGWGQDSDKAQALAAGFNHHFTKPIEPGLIMALLRSEAFA